MTVTLFVLMVVNNWFILMDGYAFMTSEGSRLYFMSFYIITMIFITIVVAFILEAFLFRIQYRLKMGDIDREFSLPINMTLIQIFLAGDTMVTIDVVLPQEEVIEHILGKNYDPSSSNFGHLSDRRHIFTFHGSRHRSKFSFCQKMYADEVKEWLQKAEEEDRKVLLETRVTAINEETYRVEERRRRLSCPSMNK